ncbi:cytochrome P450 [Streptomyces sp. BI20]|uniref:cytochrome P450 n=1 Tax=Streptomyces sp. BI20 TaxID=3403460 RepID=UPI003C759152
MPTASGALPVVGHGAALLRDPMAFLTSLSAYGPLVTVMIGGSPTVFVSDPGLARQVLTHDRVFDKGGPMVERARAVVGNGLVGCPHAEHRRQRRLCQPSFQPERLADYGRHFLEAARVTAAGWRDGQIVDVVAEMQVMAIRAVLDTIFSGGLPAGVVAPTLADLDTVVGGVFRRMVTPSALERVPVVGSRGFTEALARLNRTMESLIEVGRRQAAAGTEDPAAAGQGVTDAAENLLGVLIRTVDPEAAGDARTARLDRGELADQVFTFFGAGSETTANTLAWAWELLGRHPEPAGRLWREIADAATAGPLTHGRLAELDLTDRVVTETLRLRPPAWLIGRRTTEPVDLGGVSLPVGTDVAVSPVTVHHDPAWYPDPERFDPDRWVGVRPHRERFLAFGGGPRRCIGDRFAQTEMVAALAVIGSRWRLETVDARPPRVVPGITLRPRGLRMRVRAHTA